MCVFVCCMFVCLFVCLLACLPACLLVCLFVRSVVRSLVFVRWFAGLLVRPLVCFVHLSVLRLSFYLRVCILCVSCRLTSLLAHLFVACLFVCLLA